MKKEINTLIKRIKLLNATGDNKELFELSKSYNADRNRLHKEMRQQYADLFGIIQCIRKLSVLGVQNIDFLFEKNEEDFRECSKRYNALKPMLIKYINVFDEIICLIENGFPDGAMQRWRSLYEYSIIVLFILEQGEEVATAYTDHFYVSIKDDLKPRTNYAWARTADCLREEKHIGFSDLLDNINGIDSKSKTLFIGMYRLISQSIHGSPVGINLTFNNHIFNDINDSNGKDADYFSGGVDTVITHTLLLFFRTILIYFNTFPDGGMNTSKYLKDLFEEYVKVYKETFNVKEVGIEITIMR